VVNPVPFDVARERFGGPVVAVAVHSASQEHTLPEPAAAQWPTYVAQLLAQPWMQRAPALRTWLEEYLDNSEQRQPRSPWSIRRILDRALDITQQEVVRQRMRFNPPDLVVTPDVRDIGVLEFYRAREAIDAGRSAALAALPQLQRLAHAD
jgi:NTE family protein